MPGEYEQFICPCCGMHAPITRVLSEGPFELAQFHKKLGGKVKMDYDQRMDRTRKETYRGSGKGLLTYEPVELSPEVQEAVVARLRESLAQLGQT